MVELNARFLTILPPRNSSMKALRASTEAPLPLPRPHIEISVTTTPSPASMNSSGSIVRSSHDLRKVPIALAKPLLPLVGRAIRHVREVFADAVLCEVGQDAINAPLAP